MTTLYLHTFCLIQSHVLTQLSPKQHSKASGMGNKDLPQVPLCKHLPPSLQPHLATSMSHMSKLRQGGGVTFPRTTRYKMWAFILGITVELVNHFNRLNFCSLLVLWHRVPGATWERKTEDWGSCSGKREREYEGSPFFYFPKEETCPCPVEKDRSLTPCIIDKAALSAQGHLQGGQLSQVLPPTIAHQQTRDQTRPSDPRRNWRDRVPPRRSFCTDFSSFNLDLQG